MQTLVVPALGVLQRDLRTSATGAGWILSALLLSSAVLTPLIGRLGDQYGRRDVLLLVLAVYGVGTAAAAAARNIGELVAARAVQGCSLSVLPLAFAILREALPAQRLQAGIAMVSGLVGAGAGAGLVIGGLLTDHVSWRYLFVLGAALAMISFVLVLVWIPSARHAQYRRASWADLDLPGALVLGLSLVALLLGLTQGPDWGWSSGRVLGLFGLAVVFAVTLVFLEVSQSSPLLDIREFTHRPMLATHLSAFLYGVVSYVFYVTLPRYAQTPQHSGGYGFGTSITVAALIMLPGALIVMPASMAVGGVAHRLGQRAPLLVGFVVTTVGAALLAGAHGSIWEHVVFYTVIGAGSGLVMAALPRKIAELAPPERMGTTNGINNIARTVGGCVGTQVAAVLIASGTSAKGVTTGSTFVTVFSFAAGIGLLGALAVPLAFSKGGLVDLTPPETARAASSRSGEEASI
ncbi:MFS transporter [Frankia sp. CNm7]|nr:MFS transporter [Frankia nepalensis]MBL7512969.1 MFS transporter [Frankia nepalensis]MBL7521325.1 MFS transporter [Frankia nepalensis]